MFQKGTDLFGEMVTSVTMSLTKLVRRSGFRTFIAALCAIYLLVVFTFHADLEEGQGRSPPDGKRAVGRTPAPRRSGRHGGPSNLFHDDAANAADAAEVKVKYEVDKVYVTPDTNEGCVGYGAAEQFTFATVVRDLYAYSAFYDERPNDFDNHDNGTYIRVMVVFKSFGERPPLTCSFETLNGDLVTSPMKYYEMCENHGRPYGGYILSCKIPREISRRPCGVMLSGLGAATGPVLKVRSIKPKAQQQHKFAICVPPLFGHIDKGQLVEFLELSQLLGASHVTFYDFEIADEITEVLNHYQGLGVTSLVPWPLPRAADRQMWYHGQLVAIQDCLYRNMPDVQYLSFNDIDEFVVPHKHSSWSEMMAAMFQPSQCAFQFHSAFFDPGYNPAAPAAAAGPAAAPVEGDVAPAADPQPGAGERLLTRRAVQRTSRMSEIRTKCMLKPHLVFEKGIHHVSKPILAHLEVRRMPVEVAFLHHYRNCKQDFGMNCNGRAIDDRAPRLAPGLELAYQDALRGISAAKAP